MTAAARKTARHRPAPVPAPVPAPSGHVPAKAELTELRRAVLELVQRADRPLTAYQLLDRLKEIRKGAMPPTIYRALDFLIEKKLIHKVETLNVFVPCEAGHHEHMIQFLICRICGQVTELENIQVAGALERAAIDAGFRPASATVEIIGTCAACWVI
jgi:Fur family zinc uptake transcriptional regulator